MPPLISLALRNLVRQKARTAMTAAAIALGTVGILLSGGFVQDVFHQLGEALIHSQSGHLQIAKHGFFAQGSRKPDQYLIPGLDRVAATIAAMPEVAEVMGRVQFSGLLNNGRTDLSIIGEGIEPDAEARLGTSLVIAAGRRLSDGDRYGMLVGHGVATSLRLKPGDQVTLVVTTGQGAMNTLELEVVGVFQSFSKDYDARAVRVSLKAAHELLDHRGSNTLVIALKRTVDTVRVAGELEGRFRGQGLELKTWPELNDFYAKTVELYERQFGVLQLIILVMVVLSVTNTVNMTLFERTGEFGTMRALGNRGRDILILIVTENTLLGLAAAAGGVAVGVVIAVIVSAIGIPMPPPPNADLGYTAQIRIVPSVVGSAFAVGVVATILASIAPALRAARTEVVEALRQNV